MQNNGVPILFVMVPLQRFDQAPEFIFRKAFFRLKIERYNFINKMFIKYFMEIINMY